MDESEARPISSYAANVPQKRRAYARWSVLAIIVLCGGLSVWLVVSRHRAFDQYIGPPEDEAGRRVKILLPQGWRLARGRMRFSFSGLIKRDFQPGGRGDSMVARIVDRLLGKPDGSLTVFVFKPPAKVTVGGSGGPPTSQHLANGHTLYRDWEQRPVVGTPYVTFVIYVSENRGEFERTRRAILSSVGFER